MPLFRRRIGAGYRSSTKRRRPGNYGRKRFSGFRKRMGRPLRRRRSFTRRRFGGRRRTYRGRIAYKRSFLCTDQKEGQANYSRGRRFPRARRAFKSQLRAALSAQAVIVTRDGEFNEIAPGGSNTRTLAYDFDCRDLWQINYAGQSLVGANVTPGISFNKFAGNNIKVNKFSLFQRVTNTCNYNIKVRGVELIAKRDIPMNFAYPTTTVGAAEFTFPPFVLATIVGYSDLMGTNLTPLPGTPTADNFFYENHPWSKPMVKYYYRAIVGKEITLTPNSGCNFKTSWTPRMSISPFVMNEYLPNPNYFSAGNANANWLNGMYSWKGLNDHMFIIEFRGQDAIQALGGGGNGARIAPASCCVKTVHKAYISTLPYHGRVYRVVTNNGGDTVAAGVRLKSSQTRGIDVATGISAPEVWNNATNL